ncbi:MULTISPECIES: ankyrin repeat domain-containing protein [Myroides]|uniref:ankyrin repeat domain-containing protein n=1 Tax=Myroides TaxID=76831 RepID=UPI001320EF81|nr:MULTISPECIES: ankyrin repeat domain-containing protein [Myroides]MVX34832.1 hypothetical protein [Myroides sp. LoEW2-1]UVD79189.1 ankyrin repeat domain-containing protein [Myroides albus]
MSRIVKYWSLLLFAVLMSSTVLANCSSDNNSKSISTEQANQTMEFFQAIDKQDIAQVKRLIRDKANLEVVNKKGQTPLMYALYKAYNDIASLLIDAGANVNAQDDMLNSPFLYAGAEGNLQIAQKALSHGADFQVFNRYGGTALIPAAEKGHLDMVILLANTKGFPIDHVNNLGWTAIMEVVLIGKGSMQTQIQITKELIKAGVDVNIPDNKGVTALSHAIELGKKQIAELIKNAGGK